MSSARRTRTPRGTHAKKKLSTKIPQQNPTGVAQTRNNLVFQTDRQHVRQSDATPDAIIGPGRVAGKDGDDGKSLVSSKQKRKTFASWREQGTRFPSEPSM